MENTSHPKEKSIAYKHNWIMFGRWEIMTYCKMCFVYFCFIRGCSELVLFGRPFLCLLCSVPAVSQALSHTISQDSLFKEICIAKQFWKIEILSLSLKQKRKTVFSIKDPIFPNSGFSSVCSPYCVCIYYWALFMLVCGKFVVRNGSIGRVKAVTMEKEDWQRCVWGKNNRIVHSVFVGGGWDSWIAKCSLGKGTQGSRVLICLR